jgi:tRNA A-37 threonylcarbamoyl transferase component Bud32
MEFLLPSSNQSSTVKSKSPSKTRTKRARSVSLSKSKTPTRTRSNSNTRKERTYAPKKKKSEKSRLEKEYDSFFNFTDFTKVGTESVNGTVYIINTNNKYGEDIEEPYRHNQLTNTRKSLAKSKSKQKSTGFTYIIKTSQNNKADNLAYEYLVGQWLNQFTSNYDCFLYTYTLYHTDTQTLYHTGKYTNIKKLLDYNNKNTRIGKLANTYKTTTQDVGNIRSIICGQHTNLLLVQEFVEGSTFYDYLKKGTLSDHDIWCILYQIYYPLSQLVKQDFYHGDLHVKNVLIKEVPYEKIYNGFKIQCNYRAYMIDYGRSIYPFTHDDLVEVYKVDPNNIQKCGLQSVMNNYQTTDNRNPNPIVNPDIRLYNSIAAPKNKKYSIEEIIETIQKKLPEVSKKSKSREKSLSA